MNEPLGKQEKNESEVSIVTLETRDNFQSFKRDDQSASNYERNKIIFFGIGLLVIPLRLFLVFSAFFGYWVVLRVIEFLSQRGLISHATESWLCRILVRPGGRLLLFYFGAHWIQRHYLSETETEKLLLQVRGQVGDDGLDEKYKKKPPLVVVGNHTCYFDPVTVLAEQNECSIIARAGTEKVTIVGKLALQLKCFFTGAGGIVNQMKERAKLYYDDPDFKTRMLVFPEATTTIGTHVIRFHDGCFRLGVPVQPMIIRFPYKSFNPCWSGIGDLQYYLHLFSQFHIPMEIVHFNPYYPTAAERANPALFADNVRKMMVLGANLKITHMPPLELGVERFERVHERKENCNSAGEPRAQ